MDISEDAQPGEEEKAVLDERDEIWVRFKNQHIFDTLFKLSDEVASFASNNENTSKLKRGGEIDIEEAMQVIRNMPKYKELMKKYTLHIELCQEASKRFTDKRWKDLINLEQQIITGIDDFNKEVPNIDIISAITKLSKDLQRDDHTRLLLQYLVCYELSPKDRNMITSIQDDNYEQILENLPYVFPEFEQGTKLKRRAPVMTESEFSVYRKKQDKVKFLILRSTPEIVKIAVDASNDDFDTERFDFIGDPPEESKKVKKQKQQKKGKDISEILNNPRIILFVIGGLSHHEIVSLNKIQQEGNIQCQIIAGSTSIMKPSEMLEYLKDIHKFSVHTTPLAKRMQKEDVLKRADPKEEAKAHTSSINGGD